MRLAAERFLETPFEVQGRIRALNKAGIDAGQLAPTNTPAIIGDLQGKKQIDGIHCVGLGGNASQNAFLPQM